MIFKIKNLDLTCPEKRKPRVGNASKTQGKHVKNAGAFLFVLKGFFFIILTNLNLCAFITFFLRLNRILLAF